MPKTRELTINDFHEGMIVRSKVYARGLENAPLRDGTYMLPNEVGIVRGMVKDFKGTVRRIDLDTAATSIGYRKYFVPLVSETLVLAEELSKTESKEFLLEFEKARNDVFMTRGIPTLRQGSTGSDPEVFALDEHGKVVPAFDWLPSKQERQERQVWSGSPFWDGFQAEFNPPPESCHQSLQNGVRGLLKATHTALKAFNKKAYLVAKSVVDVDEEGLKLLSDDRVGLGCQASENAYGDTPLEVLDPRALLYRTAGCHIHFGIGRGHDERIKDIVKTIDSIAGVGMVSLFDGMEDPRRRRLYGRAGEFRLPPHGLEYRVPPAEVLCHPVVFMACFDLCRHALGMAIEVPNLWKAREKAVQEIINESDVKGARKILATNKDVFQAIARGMYGSYLKNFETLVWTGAKNWLPVDDLTENWKLDYKDSLGLCTPKGGYQVNTSILTKQENVPMALAQGV